MSADHWDVCPSCLARAKEVKAAQVQRVAESYGKVDIAEFDAIRAEAEKPIDTEALRTFREDYEFYLADDNAVKAVYKGWCTVCATGVEFRDSHPITMKAPQ